MHLPTGHLHNHTRLYHSLAMVVNRKYVFSPGLCYNHSPLEDRRVRFGVETQAERSTTECLTAFASTATVVMVAYVLSRTLALVREVLLADAFGTTAELDAFRAASRVTETLYLLIAGGALGSAFIPRVGSAERRGA
jgi:hypothetical protein